ncbi:MAG: Transcriptional regulator, LysR family [uncultured Sphingomonas sp.]|uniref:Transcriptional regulator, LysR family n=1 Tax=uncultured Sphingomonas sp. TaxID=158754 RepID=A0A6J4T9M8_9SPHN|nr:LysR family transcriptional regulator [uncultured Sphingomonas sp.]CAA9517433.1 MAG: Transcriptional regulator, LysR family [uncultured Sphingomonas sp.]
MIDRLEGLTVFLAVAETRSFRAASERLGVTRSAVSQAFQRLEDRLGVALAQRTTRSVHLTEAGEQLYAAAHPAFDQLGAALRAAQEMRGRPTGRLRLCVSSIAESFLTGPALPGFLAAHPAVGLDITVTDAEFDIVREGYDAGVRLGEAIDQDMIAIPVSAEQRQVTVVSPDYLARYGAPAHPRELVDHICIGWRPKADVAPYRWEYTEDGRDFDVAVEPRATTNDMNVMIRLACADAGLTFGMKETFQPYLERGELVTVLDAFLPPFPGFYLFFPKRQHQPAKLRALIDYFRAEAR